MNVSEITEAVRRRYQQAAVSPAGLFAYPVGRASVASLGYRPDLAARIPASVVDRFLGVGNPFSMGEPLPGWNVVDIGCGCGFDTQTAAYHVGPTGTVVGVDVSLEMLAAARVGLLESGLGNVDLREGPAEKLPVDSGWADLVISNGVLNLATCKPSAFAEIARVLKPGGRLQAADLILVGELPADLLDDKSAWSS